jgi:hypothetical protein
VLKVKLGHPVDLLAKLGFKDQLVYRVSPVLEHKDRRVLAAHKDRQDFLVRPVLLDCKALRVLGRKVLQVLPERKVQPA